MTAEKAERTSSPHTHDCPDCGKLIPCEKAGEKCDEYVSKLLHDFPCEGRIRKQYEAPEGVCVHCGEEKTTDEMEPLSSKFPSNCCTECWAAIKEEERLSMPQRHEAWMAAVKREEAEGLRRARTKAQKKRDDLEEKGQMVIEEARPGLRLVQ